MSEVMPGKQIAPYEPDERDLEWADLRSAVRWAREHRILVAAVVLIAAQVAWKAQFLSHLYFRQDDFHDLDLAVDHSFNWGYLTYIGAGHLIIGLRVVAWFCVRVGGTYNWGLASAVSLAFVAAAGLAALRVLRLLFGERPLILIPLGLYLLSALTMPDLGIWSSAMESVPLQLAIFMALASHVHYARTGRARHLAAAGFWVAFGLAFFEKGLVLPLFLFAVTAAFLADRGSLLSGAFRALRLWKAWALYGALMAGYAILLAVSLRTSTVQPHPPGSLRGVATFAWGLVRESLVPGALGGPWQWLPVADRSYSFAAPPAAQIWLAGAVAVAVIGVTILLRRRAWRAWAILAGWVVLADMLPVVIGRVNAFSPAVLGLETRYLADAVPVIAVCLGLALAPVVALGARPAGAPAADRPRPSAAGQHVRTVAAALIGLYVFGAILSVQEYTAVTSGNIARSYIANAVAAVRAVPRGTPVFNRAVPGDIVEGLFGGYAQQSKVLGDIARGKLRWIARPSGTLDGLMLFSQDGRLHDAAVNGAPSLPRPAGAKCWPARNGRIAVRLWRFSPPFTGILRIGYLASGSGVIEVRFAGAIRSVPVQRGLHTAYVSVTGIGNRVVVVPPAGLGLCVGDAQVGNLGPAADGRVLPPAPAG